MFYYRDVSIIFFFHFQLLIVLTIVIFFGAMAAIYNKPELWALYSVAQGVQVSSGFLFIR